MSSDAPGTKRGAPRELSPARPPRHAGQWRPGGLTCLPGVPRQHHARGGRGRDDDVGYVQVLVAQDGGLVMAAPAAAATHFKA